MPQISNPTLSMNSKLKLLACTLALLLPALPGQARTVAWYSAIGDTFLQSDGLTALDSTYQFELGGFTSGFDPLLNDMSLWASNWVVFDTATDASGEWNSIPGISNYSSSGSTISAGGANLTSSVTGNAFTVGQRAYVWAFNSKTIAPTSEWALVTNTAWTFPTADALALPLDWTLTDAANTTVYGDLTHAPPDVNGDVASTLQLQAVPEPSSALLIAVAGVLLRLRRRAGRRS